MRAGVCICRIIQGGGHNFVRGLFRPVKFRRGKILPSAPLTTQGLLGGGVPPQPPPPPPPSPIGNPPPLRKNSGGDNFAENFVFKECGELSPLAKGLWQCSVCVEAV